MFMSYLQAIIIGIVQGITEFLPISSTGHMILTAELLKIQSSDFLTSFEIVIQLGSILAVVVLYWKTLWRGIDLWLKLLVAFLPSAVIGLILYKFIKQMLAGNTTVLWALFLGGIAIIIFEYFHKEKETDVDEVEKISYRQALTIGFFQCLAMIPGVSRSAATVIGGLTQGLKRKTIVEFSFLLAIPTMFAATGLDLLKNASSFSLNQAGILSIGFITAFFVAILGIKFLLRLVKKYTFVGFGIYRIVVAVLFWVLVN